MRHIRNYFNSENDYNSYCNSYNSFGNCLSHNYIKIHTIIMHPIELLYYFLVGAQAQQTSQIP